MKKIVSILLLIVFISANFSFAADGSCAVAKCAANEICENTSPTTHDCKINIQTSADCNKGDFGEWNPTTRSCCPKGQIVDSTTNQCIANTTPENEDPTSSTSVMGIDCDQDKLVNGQCKLNIYDTLGIRKSVRDSGQATSVGLFVQDVVLSATFFIGTLVTVALVVSGIMFIFAASSGKDPANAKKGIIGSLVGLLIVVSSYVIIRLVQYVAKGF